MAKVPTSYEVKPGNIFGRIGTGIGQGLAEQLPKEMERGRLSSGLKQFEQESGNLSPLQSLARLASIPGALQHPQLIQSASELAKQQGMRNAYTNANQQIPKGKGSEEFRKDSQIGQQLLNEPKSSIINELQKDTTKSKPGQPQIVDKNPLREEAIPKKPWTPLRRNSEISNLIQQFPQVPIEQIQQIAADNEARELSQPKAEQQQDIYFQEQQKKLNDKFKNFLETKLQKNEEGVFKDISGEMLVNTRRAMERELKTNPNATVDDVADDYSERLLDLSKAKSQMDALAASSIWALPIILDKEKYRNKLMEYGDIFDKAGNKEEFYNALQSKFDMSPQGAASLAYPRNKQVASYLDKVKPSKMHDPIKSNANSRKYAADIENLITDNDSLLAIAFDLRQKDPYFNQKVFFKQLSEDKDRIGLNAIQQRELAEGASDILPNWSDVLILPFFRGW